MFHCVVVEHIIEQIYPVSPNAALNCVYGGWLGGFLSRGILRRVHGVLSSYYMGCDRRTMTCALLS